MKKDLWWKTTFNRGPLWWKTIFYGRCLLMEDNIWWKTSFDGRQHSMEYLEDILWWRIIFDGRQPLMVDFLWRKMTFDGRRSLMEGFLNWSLTQKTKSCIQMLLCCIGSVKLYHLYHTCLLWFWSLLTFLLSKFIKGLLH